MSLRVTLNLQVVAIAPGAEWPLTAPTWRLQQVVSGFGYCISGIHRRELAVGETMLASPKAVGVIRASQLGELSLHFLTWCPNCWGAC